VRRRILGAAASVVFIGTLTFAEVYMRCSLAVSLAAVVMLAGSAVGADTMQDQNKAVARKFFDEVFNTGKVELLEKFVAADAVEHELFQGQKEPVLVIDQVKLFLGQLRAAFPDLKAEIKDLVAEGDKVVARIVLTGTHKGDFNGIPATGKTVSFDAIDIIRFANGKCVEHWGVTDEAGLMAQIAPTVMVKPK
jgi:steroid delta-isomerase-like uncharacterized protein